MKCQVIKQFKRRGELQAEGSIIEIPQEAFSKLAGYVKAVASADSYPPDVIKPDSVYVTRAWLENLELRTTGVFSGVWPDGGLTPEIVKLTAGNMKLQESLLRLHVPAYSPPVWINTIRQWRERARHLFEVEGQGLHDADYQSATELHLLAFMGELTPGRLYEQSNS